MYPKFVAEAEVEGGKQASQSFQNALAVEEIHHNLYSEALKALDGGGDMDAEKIFVCGICGNTVYGEAPDKCPICHALKKMFAEIE